MIDAIWYGQVHWIWVLVALNFGACLGYVASGLLRNIEPGGEYFPDIDEAEHLYRPRVNVTPLNPRIEK